MHLGVGEEGYGGRKESRNISYTFLLSLGGGKKGRGCLLLKKKAGESEKRGNYSRRLSTWPGMRLKKSKSQTQNFSQNTGKTAFFGYVLHGTQGKDDLMGERILVDFLFLRNLVYFSCSVHRCT